VVWFTLIYADHSFSMKIVGFRVGVAVNGERLKVLMLEESNHFISMIRRALSQSSGSQIEITHAINMGAALENLSGRRFDAIVMDLSGPDGKDFEALARVQGQSPETPIVVLTDKDNVDFGIQAMRRGAQDYMVKGRVTGQLLLRSLRYAIERHQMLDTLRRLAMVDELTGLYNHRGFQMLAEQHLKLSQRLANSLVLIALDLDNMTSINDQYGQDEGDLALVRTAETLRKTFRSSDIIARIGGDEFVILAIDVTPSSARQILKRLKENLADAGFAGKSAYQLSARVEAIPVDPDEAIGIDELLERAGQVLVSNSLCQ
jgi:two-component system, cell cycle response regulator